MTTFVPSLTLPAAIFANPTASVLLPITLGSAIGSHKRNSKGPTWHLNNNPLTFHPPYVFGPAWTLLYGLMGYSAYRAYSTGLSPLASTENHLLFKQGATLYTIQLGLNLIWMPLFFSLKRPILATIDIVALTGTVSYLTYIWGQVDSVAAWALAPYVGWLGFATYLSAGVGYLNDWNISDKEVEKSPKGKGTKYVDEKEE
ncbi:uncharacterized protein EAF02_008630 [Botrytis sinoallii]|uniref:uncharacterized protein n=1 Tax=Botrytis sinoallii TaxID=1463999 RepID=UPI0019026187|nr:uncharacterized protein EAF02_008630 [Botrytis sinoallii]KAF7874653.1 hypothetical protein EAF02_008630 [Botrytis sinoallii]